jgi:hypothetical protein
MISSSRRNTLFLTAATIVLISALSGCRGFFVKPTLSSLTVTPASPNLQVGQTQQLAATGNFNDGTTGSVSNVSWSSGDSSHVTVSNSGLIKGIANTTSGVIITATSGTVSGTATVTVGQSSTITVTSDSGTTISIGTTGEGSTLTFTATQGGTDVTSSATWSSSNTNIISTPSAGQATLVGTQTGVVTITAKTSTGSGSVQVTVTI